MDFYSTFAFIAIQANFNVVISFFFFFWKHSNDGQIRNMYVSDSIWAKR